MPKDKPIKRDEIIGVLTLILLFISVVGGREIGNFYASYQEMTKLKVLFEITEEELSRYFNELAMGEETDLEVGIIITRPGVDNSADIVTITPDYVKRYMIGLTVSPVVVIQPSASDVELEMLIENMSTHEAYYSYPKEKISFIRYTDRLLRLDFDDVDELLRVIEGASEKHGGEIEVTFTGRVHVHLLFLDTWLPFTVTRYPIIKVPHIDFVDSKWMSYTEGSVSKLDINEPGYVLAEFRNPTRLHSLREDVTCILYKDDAMVFNLTKNVQLAPGTNGQYIFPFQLTESGDYTYIIKSEGELLEEGNVILHIE
jgi:hypothetical protein